MNNIQVSISKCPQNTDITLLTVRGFIDTTTAPEFEKNFFSVLSDKRFKLVVDLSDVNYISSAGWGVFISEIKGIREQKGDLLLAGMTPEVSEVFALLEFNSFMKAYPDVESAVAKGFGEITDDHSLGEPVDRGERGKNDYREKIGRTPSHRQ